MRTIIIGDVHGCLDELLTLVSRCGYGAGDRLILVGDLVAKGPDSIGVVSWARESRVEAVLGNHEEHVLRMLFGMNTDHTLEGVGSNFNIRRHPDCPRGSSSGAGRR